jgi:histidyl-tRNA synthetase
MKLEPPKGTKDFMPEDEILKNRIVETLKEIFELYGFDPFETPCLANYETLASKYAGGAEILKETYQLVDRGGRKLGLRYDLTVPLCRVIASTRISKPFKRYEIGKTWRDGPMKTGRYREFWQCDVDVVGPQDIATDAEFIAIAEAVFKKLGLDVEIKINSRKLLDGILQYAGIEKSLWNPVLQSTDKLAKLGEGEVRKELKEKSIAEEKIEKVLQVMLSKKAGFSELEKTLSNEIAKDGIRELEALLSYAKNFGVDMKNVKWDISLSRGLDYYTGTVYEVYLKNSKITSAVAGGGRFDEIIGGFSGSGSIPAVGISFGLDVIMDAMREKEKWQKSVVTVFVANVNEETRQKSIEIAQKLRSAGISTDFDLMNRNLKKQFDYVNTKKIPFCVVIGPKELKENCVVVRNMESGKEEKVKIEQLAKHFQTASTTP